MVGVVPAGGQGFASPTCNRHTRCAGRDHPFRPSGCHDGSVTARNLRIVLAAAVLSLLGVGCSGMSTPRQSDASKAATSATVDPVTGDTIPSAANNPFLPEDRNLGECVSSLPRPDCGSSAQGGWAQGATFGALMLGMAFIGWRIFRGVRKRDQQQAERSTASR